MKLKKVNDFFGMALSLTGVLKIVFMVCVMIQSGKAAAALTAGVKMTRFNHLTFSTVIAYVQIFLAIASIVMIFVNLKRNSEAVSGYLIGLFALILEVILPSIIYFIYVFWECSLYIKAGNKIRNKNFKWFYIDDNVNIKLEDTDWFFKNKK